MTFQEFFDQAKELFSKADASSIQEHLAYQFNITGEAEGIFYVEVKDGKIDVQPYDYHDRDAMFIASAKTFEKIIAGKQDPVVAFTLGKLKVEGSIEKALRIKDMIK